jgi:hypothetical protein
LVPVTSMVSWSCKADVCAVKSGDLLPSKLDIT